MVDFMALISSKTAGFCTDCDITRLSSYECEVQRPLCTEGESYIVFEWIFVPGCHWLSLLHFLLSLSAGAPYATL